MRCVKAVKGRKQCGGFTLFEMVVVICAIAILYRVAEQRLNELPAAAERASYYAILEQLKIGVNFEMYSKLTRADFAGIQNLEGTNPMDLLLEAPNNYRGELVEVTDQNVERRASWYFESSTGELVYVVGGSSIENVFIEIGEIPVNYGQIRLKLTNVFSNRERAARELLQDEGGGESDESDESDENSESKDSWEALLIEPKWSYTWARREDLPLPI